MNNRRQFLKKALASSAFILFAKCAKPAKRPNILFCISDDQSFEHTSFAGCPFIHTPAFDRVAREGVFFKNAFVSAPSCNPSRGSILTGNPFYRLKEAAMNHTVFSDQLTVYTDVLQQSGYFVGYTGKGCAPTNWQRGGRNNNPAGPAFNTMTTATGTGIANDDYAANFQEFLKQKPAEQPFCFWFGAKEPHRVFKKGIGLRHNKNIADVNVPPFLPDSEEVRSDLLDYAVHTEWFDTNLAKMMQQLEAIDELDNTLIVVTSDNGMAFPRAKGTCYDSGTHMPLAIRWGGHVKPNRVVDDFVSFADFAPTFLKAANIAVPNDMCGKSLMPVLLSEESGQIDPERNFVITGIERHFPGSRKNSACYPIRAIRTDEYLFIRNVNPERYPAGDPHGAIWPDDDVTGGFGDIDGSPTKAFIHKNKRTHSTFYDAAFGKRPAEELYDIQADPYQMTNLADDSQYAEVIKSLKQKLEKELIKTNDPRLQENCEFDAFAEKFNLMSKF